MHKLFASLVALGAFALIASPAQAEKWQALGGKHSKDEIKGTCKKEGGTFFEDITGGNYSCVKSGGGSVSCEKGGKCWGCGTGGTATGCQDAPRKSGSRTTGGVLTNAQPLTQQKVTRSPKTAPTKPLTQQTVTRSPKTAPMQPKQQKTTGSAGTRPMQPMAAAPSSRSRGR